MFRGYGKRTITGWTAIGCVIAFGVGAVVAKRVQPLGPIDIRELPATGQLPHRAAVTPAPPPLTMPAPVAAPIRSVPGAEQRTSDASHSAPRRSHGKAEPALQSISINGELPELEALPGVGPSIAQRIVDYRLQHGPYQSLDELRNVKGIGAKRYAKLEPYLRL